MILLSRRRERGSVMKLPIKMIRERTQDFVKVAVGSDQGVKVTLMGNAGYNGEENLRR
jgi:hypothetical protein